jgi:hypothetical protein
VSREFTVSASGTIRVSLIPKTGAPLLSGIEIEPAPYHLHLECVDIWIADRKPQCFPSLRPPIDQSGCSNDRTRKCERASCRPRTTQIQTGIFR